MTNTKEAINKYRKRRQADIVQFDILDDDALVLNGRYKGMKLSDVFIVNPGFLQWLISDHRTEAAVKMIAKMIRRDAEKFSDSIRREIVTNHDSL